MPVDRQQGVQQEAHPVALQHVPLHASEEFQREETGDGAAIAADDDREGVLQERVPAGRMMYADRLSLLCLGTAS